MFGFTTFKATDKLEPDAWRAAPATIQVALVNKLDIRVTVIEDEYCLRALLRTERLSLATGEHRRAAFSFENSICQERQRNAARCSSSL